MKSETNAWANAKRKIEQQEKECTHCQEEDPVFGMKYPCHCKQILEQPKQQQQ